RSSLRSSRAPRRFPQPRRRQTFPAEGLLTRPLLLQMLKPLNGLPHRRPMSGWHPPHDEVTLVHPLEPLVAAAITALMHGLPNKPPERLDGLPYREVDRHARVAIERTGLDRASAVVLVAPNKSGALFCQAVHERKIIDEVGHARIANLITEATDI